MVSRYNQERLQIATHRPLLNSHSTQKLASQINEIKAFSYEEEEGESVESLDIENEDSSTE